MNTKDFLSLGVSLREATVRAMSGRTGLRWNSGRDRQHFYNTQKLPIEEVERVMEQLLMKSPKHRK